MKRASPTIAWAVIVKSTRSEWINHFTIRYSKADARRAYKSQWREEYREQAEKDFQTGAARLAKITISLC